MILAVDLSIAAYVVAIAQVPVRTWIVLLAVGLHYLVSLVLKQSRALRQLLGGCSCGWAGSCSCSCLVGWPISFFYLLLLVDYDCPHGLLLAETTGC
jgi:hypothetical protein